MVGVRISGRGASGLAAFLLVLLSGCGGGNSPSAISVSIAVAPQSTVMKLNATQQFSATITGSSNSSVAWSVNGVPGGNAIGGTITAAGLYTSPASQPAGGAVKITATSQAETTASASASVLVLPPFVTIPSVQQWTASSGAYTFSAASRIVIDPANAPDLTTTANVLAADLKYLTGLSIQTVAGTPNTGDISLSLLASTDTGLGAEGYSMNVAGTVAISANSDAGVFYGTRTLLQLLSQGLTIGFGTIRDWPDYPQRIHMVDVGRKFFTIQWLEDHIRDLAFAKINLLHLHLSDDQGFRIQSTSHPELNSGTSPIYSKAEISSLIQLAAQYHITIIPEIDVPSHSQAILAAHPELRLTNAAGATLDDSFDITLPGTYTLVGDLLDEYLAFFPGPYWHGAADEYLGVGNFAAYPQLAAFATANIGPTATQYDTYLYFENWIDNKVTAAGKSTRMWNDPYNYLVYTGTAEGLNKDILVEMWQPETPPQNAIDLGYSIIDASYQPLYYVTDVTYTSSQNLYEDWAPNLEIGDPQWSVAAQDPHLPGASFEIWCDDPTQDETVVDQNTWIPLREFAQNIWGSPKLVPAYTEFDSLASAFGRAPGFGSAGGPVAMTSSAPGGDSLCASRPEPDNFDPLASTKPTVAPDQAACFGSEH
jgi:hexosaminidase